MPLRLWLAMGGVVAVMLAATWVVTAAYQHGRQAERAATLSRSVEIMRQRSAVDDQIRTMDSAALCRALGGLPDECDGLDL